MPYCSSYFILREAQQMHYAVPAVNVENMEMVLAAIQAAEQQRSPIILQTTPSTIAYGGLNIYAGLVRAAAVKASVPVALHLDHGNSFELAESAAKAGYSSLMIDGSKLPFQENTALTQRTALMAERYGLPLEAELGELAGKEDAQSCTASSYTDPDRAVVFISLTGITSLAVSIGTAHGIYKGEPHIDLDRLEQIRKKTTVPLVLHGSSGLTDQVIRNCIERGICKVNFATELRQTYSNALKAYLAEYPDTFDPKAYSKPAREAVCNRVQQIIALCCSAGRVMI